jgi:proteasome lid subunit RPN8/RPN11
VVIHIPDDVIAAMKAHAERAYPEECCGLLIGVLTQTARRILHAVPLANAAPESRQSRYAIDPRAWLAAEKEAAAAGGEIFGVFHSHPDHPARPSETDRALAFENLSYVIIPVAAGVAGDLTCWQFIGSEFIPEPFHRPL